MISKELKIMKSIKINAVSKQNMQLYKNAISYLISNKNKNSRYNLKLT